MPRDLSGNFTRVSPPGAAGYQFNTDIDQNQVNAEFNDIGAELTDSISASGKKTATANLPMGGFVHSGLGMADADGETVRFQALKKGSDIAVIANSTVAIPAEGALFNLTAASAFNVIGFTGGYDGRTFSVRFNPDKLLTLVNSSTFKLLGGATRITRAGEIIHFVQESTGVIAEIGQQPIIDLTGYSGADIALGIGQSTVYTVTAATSLLLRIATGDNQRYELVQLPDSVGAVGVTSTAAILQPNNANTAAGAIIYELMQAAEAGPNTTAQKNTNNSFIFDSGGSPYQVMAYVSTRTKTKTLMSFTQNCSSTQNLGSVNFNRWSDTSTAWTSLGTLNWVNAWTGLLQVTRKL